jgi:hypothetical protein
MERWTEINDEVLLLETINFGEQADLDSQKERFTSATEFLQEAENTRSAAELTKQTNAYNALKTKNDALKAELEALFTQDDEGTIDQAGEKRLGELEGEFAETNEEYMGAKNALEEKQRVANEKAFNKATADGKKTADALAAATKKNKDAEAAYNAIKATSTKIQTEIDTLNKNYQAAAGDDKK